IVSSGDASQHAMVGGLVGHRVFHLGPEKDLSFFSDIAAGLNPDLIRRVPLEEAQGIVCTGLFDDSRETPEDYRATLLYAKQKRLKLLCTNPDVVVDYGDKRIYCAGALAALYSDMGGESLYFGKPHPPIYDLARQRITSLKNVADERILCIGDSLTTDIQGGLSEDMDTLFITSGLAASHFGDRENPDPVRLSAYFAAHKISPTAAISFLA
ncbi:MAG: HAD hydrolase-like protein, partial [Paracoccaceae bacterium]